MDSITAEYDQVQNLPDCTFTPPKGMEFAGWSLTQGGAVRYKTQASVRNLTAQEGDTVTLYAVWREPVVINICINWIRLFSPMYRPTSQRRIGLLCQRDMKRHERSW